MRTARIRQDDALIVGSGINSLVCAALLARSGRRVRVLERERVLGGCIRTDELTLPGLRHDTLSTAHPLFVAGPAYALLGKAPHEAGLAYSKTNTPPPPLFPHSPPRPPPHRQPLRPAPPGGGRPLGRGPRRGRGPGAAAVPAAGQ